MTISLNEFLNRISNSEELHLLVCTEAIVYDGGSRTLYLPLATHNNTSLNPLADFRTHIGHFLLWSRHAEVDCTSGELINSLYGQGFVLSGTEGNRDYTIYSLVKKTDVLKEAI